MTLSTVEELSGEPRKRLLRAERDLESVREVPAERTACGVSVPELEVPGGAGLDLAGA